MIFAVASIVLALLIASGEGCRPGRRMIKSGGLSDYEKQMIIDEHNKLRQSVALGQIHRQPPAADMLEMQWDEELASTAQRWADQCQTAHDRAQEREVSRFPVGQNIAATWTTRPPSGDQDSYPDFQKQIHAWFNEVNSYGYKPMGYSHGTGHYSQLVWGETSQVGCGFSYFYDPSRGYTKLYVCNYGPGGNVIGAHPYKKGQPSCNSYGLADSPTYNGLCSPGFSDSYNSIPESSMGYSVYGNSPFSSFNSQDDLASMTFNQLAGIINGNSLFQPRKNGFKYSFLGR